MSNVEEFLSLLSCQRDLLTRLLSLANEEYSCLVQNQPDRLDEIVQNQSRLIAAQAKLSKHVTTAMRHFVGDDYVNDDSLTLSNVAKYFDESTATAVRSYSRELTETSEQLQRQGRVNYVLSQQTLRYIDYTMRLIGNEKEGPLPYQSTPQSGINKSIQLLMDTSA